LLFRHDGERPPLQWVLSYVDGGNYDLFQMDDNNF